MKTKLKLSAISSPRRVGTGLSAFIALSLYLFIATPSTFAYSQQGFTSYNETNGTISFACSNQCVIQLGAKGTNDMVSISSLAGDGSITLGAVNANNQTIPVQTLSVKDKTSLNFFASQVGGQTLPDQIPLVLIFNGNVQGTNSTISLVKANFMNKFSAGISSASTYIPYNPRTINFMEGPMRNGKYINQQFLGLIVMLLAICSAAYRLVKKKNDKLKWLARGIGIVAFFWIFFDLFNLSQQIKVYKHTIAAGDIMTNARIGTSSDFYEFLSFVKTNTTEDKKTVFVAPYPFDFEGRYHNYPHNRIGLFTGSDYIVFYNPYGASNGFGFTDPVYSISNQTLNRKGASVSIQKKIPRTKTYGSIYIVSK